MSNELLTTVPDEASIRGRIREFILTKLLVGEDPINLTDSTPLVSGGVIDSMNSMKIGLFLEKSFGIKISPDELADPENLETVAAITRLVTTKRSA